ncbi:MAG: T9SS type A sorting domain-containing protein [Flavobacteriales bacterium]|nr:T9SS type A sorting domain-containing protein [Flavobacteriales bacterium]
MRSFHVFILIVSAFATVAQSPYRPFPESDAGWMETHSWLDANAQGMLWVTCTRTITFGADTTILGTLYHRLLRRGNCFAEQVMAPQNSYAYNETEVDLLYFRQDIFSRRVYARINSTESLFLDFNLTVGPYPPSLLSLGQQLYVVSLDSMELNDGWYRTWQIAIGPNDPPFVDIIEGVGTSYGLNPVVGALAPPFEWFDELNCHSVMGASIYPFGQDVCDLTTSVSAIPGPQHISVFPNPATDMINLSVPMNGFLGFVAYDVFGREAYRGQVLQQRINCSSWHSGVYAVQLLPQGTDPSSFRVVVE